jgi:hypothetical protein
MRIFEQETENWIRLNKEELYDLYSPDTIQDT